MGERDGNQGLGGQLAVVCRQGKVREGGGGGGTARGEGTRRWLSAQARFEVLSWELVAVQDLCLPCQG